MKGYLFDMIINIDFQDGCVVYPFFGQNNYGQIYLTYFFFGNYWCHIKLLKFIRNAIS